MPHRISVEVNGVHHESDVEARLLLVHFLREDLGLTGTNVGCESGLCGACTVLVDGLTVKSCTQLAVQADGTRVTTIEGLGSERELDPVQQAFWDRHGLQCGFCTPGMIMAIKGILEENPDPGEAEIRRGLKGNICRCTGYHNIVEAVRQVAEGGE